MRLLKDTLSLHDMSLYGISVYAISVHDISLYDLSLCILYLVYLVSGGREVGEGGGSEEAAAVV